MDNFATNEEIRIAEKYLINGEKFEQDKIDIIKCNVSCDIQACPGSGKTTTLMAKLAILANRMPLNDNKGICVITHTNVAIDEIKKKLGGKADVLFSYPNFFGTIQSFVDSYLAEPYIRQHFKTNIDRIDKSYASIAFYKKLKTHPKLYNCLEIKNTYSQTKTRRYSGIVEMLENISINDINQQIVLIDKGTQNNLFNFSTSSGKLFLKIKEELWEEGVLSFDDAYVLAKRYIRESDSLSEIFSKRFKYLFIDEMQDTTQVQMEIIDKLFDTDSVVKQLFGDSNQTIFENKGDTGWNQKNTLCISNSKRFGSSIAAILNHVCNKQISTIKGNPSVESKTPVIFLYSDKNNVLPAFEKLLSETIIDIDGVQVNLTSLAKTYDHAFYAIGWIAKKNQTASISDYYPAFFRNTPNVKNEYEYRMVNYIRGSNADSVKQRYNQIVDGFVHILRRYGIKTNKSTFLSNLEISGILNSFRKIVLQWITQSDHSGVSSIIGNVKDYFKSTICPVFSLYDCSIINDDFFSTEEIIMSTNNSESNVFSRNGVDINIATVHAVKGQTHLATLYLETSFMRNTESGRIMDYLLGSYSKPTDKLTIQTLRVAHVALSRAKYLTCMAVDINKLSQQRKNKLLTSMLWKTIVCEEYLNSKEYLESQALF